MKKLVIFLTIIFSLLLQISCNEGIPITEKTELIYEEAKKHYPDHYTQFLPELNSGKLITLSISNPLQGRGTTPICIHIVMKYSKEELHKIYMSAYSNLEPRTFKDSGLLVLDDPEKKAHFNNLKKWFIPLIWLFLILIFLKTFNSEKDTWIKPLFII